MSRRLGSRVVRLVFVASIVAESGVACTEFARTNPFDPDFTMTVTVSGPDTLTSRDQDFQMTATWNPEWPEAPIAWTPSDPDPTTQNAKWGDLIQVLGDGKFRVKAFAGPNRPIRLTVSVGPHSGFKDVILSQRLARIDWIPCSGGACVALPGTGNKMVTGWMYDTLGSKLADNAQLPAALAAQMIPRDPAVVTVSPTLARDGSIVGFTLLSHNRGATWLVPSRFADSLAIYVDDAPASVALTCPATMRVAESVQIVATVRGPTGATLLYMPTMAWGAIDSQGALGPGMTSAGIVTARVTGNLQIIAVEDMAQRVGTCDIQVSP